MKEVLIVVLSALVGYIVLSAFSVSSSPQEAIKRVIEQPRYDSKTEKELVLSRLESEREQKLAELQTQREIEALHAQENIEIARDRHNTDIKLKEIDFKKDSTIADIKYSSFEKQKSEEHKMLIAISILIFILIFIYLRYQKNLAQIEIEREKEYKDMLAKKEYAEKILSIVESGNISAETENRLLRILDDINHPTIDSVTNRGNLIRHSGSDMERLTLQKNI